MLMICNKGVGLWIFDFCNNLLWGVLSAKGVTLVSFIH